MTVYSKITPGNHFVPAAAQAMPRGTSGAAIPKASTRKHFPHRSVHFMLLVKAPSGPTAYSSSRGPPYGNPDRSHVVSARMSKLGLQKKTAKVKNVRGKGKGEKMTRQNGKEP